MTSNSRNSIFFLSVRSTFLHCMNDRFFFHYSHALYRLFLTFFPFALGWERLALLVGARSLLVF